MEDIAGIFHWPLSELEALSPDALVMWHGRAVAFWNRTHREER